MEGTKQVVLFIDEEEKIKNLQCLLSLTESIIVITRTDQAISEIKVLGFKRVMKESEEVILYQEQWEQITKVVVYSDKMETISHFLNLAKSYFKAPIILITGNKIYSDKTFKLLGADLVIFTKSIHILPFLRC